MEVRPLDRPVSAPPAGLEPFFVADHPALDMLNTLAASDGALIDFWLTDTEVLRWLERQGFASAWPHSRWRTGALAASARNLREIARVLVERRKAQRGSLSVDALNSFLARSSSHLQLRAEPSERPVVERIYSVASPDAFLAPLAESVAQLFAEGDFELVRRCEGQDCVLWFYDRTKAHRRRWCSMNLCGNRAKVAAFRQRQQA